MLAVMPKNTEYVFGTSLKVTRASVFYRLRKNLARKLGNPRLISIGLHTFRHWKATKLYHEPKNSSLVKELFGHRSLGTTLLYIQFEKHVCKEDTDTFTVKAVRNAARAPFTGVLCGHFSFFLKRMDSVRKLAASNKT
jgi:integrase